MAGKEETGESTDMTLSTEELDYVEKLENIQVSIQVESLSREEEALHIISQLTEFLSLQKDIQDSSTDIQKAASLVKEKNSNDNLKPLHRLEEDILAKKEEFEKSQIGCIVTPEN